MGILSAGDPASVGNGGSLGIKKCEGVSLNMELHLFCIFRLAVGGVRPLAHAHRLQLGHQLPHLRSSIRKDLEQGTPKNNGRML